jgi:phenylacetate-CoA ligase
MDVYARRTAVMWRGYGWAGAGLGTRTAYLWGSGPPKAGWPGLKEKLYHGAFNRRFFDAFGLSEATVDATIDDIMAYRPHALVAYVAPAVLLARRMLATGRTLKGLRGAITGAEALFDPERKDLEAAFGCKVHNTYGTREVMLIGAECSLHSGLHVNSDHLVVETVDSSGHAVPAGQTGAVAVTDLHNFGMPMVRYLNGDSATYSTQGCTCGRNLPLLQTVDGRVLDLITTPDGRALLGEFFVYVMLEWPEVRKWQVVQTAPDCVEFRLVVDSPWTEDEKGKLRARIHAKSGPGMRVDVREVEKIDDAASGKRRLTISLVHARAMGLI